MRWTVLTHPPGGATGKVCKCYAVVQKLSLLEDAYRLHQESNVSLQGTVVVLGIRHSLLVKWTKDLARLQSTPLSKKRSSYDGPKRQLHRIEHKLLMFIFSQHEQGINAKHTLVHLKASLLLLNMFGAKGYEACLRVIMRFMHKHNYVMRTKTNEATRAPQEVRKRGGSSWSLLARSFLAPIATFLGFLTWTRRPFIFPNSSKTLEKHGTKTIHIRKTGNGTNRAMGAFTITAAGNFLMPMIILSLMGILRQENCQNLTRLPSMHARKPRGWMSGAC
jgi:hypothetical protein